MSAPTALESGALARGIAWLTRSATLSRVASPERERRSQDRLAVLGREHDQLCRQACDPLEIAAVLEAAGLTDSRSRSQYQVAGVFELAEELWQSVPWRPAPDAARDDRWRLPLWRSQLRGFLYAVPALIAALVPVRGMGYTALAVATAVAIAAAQALSVLGHILVGRGQRTAVSQLSTAALGVALATTALAALLCVVLGLPVALAVAPGAQLTFVVAATLLMVSGDDRLLLVLIVPGSLAAAVQLGVAAPSIALVVTGAGTVLVTSVGAWLALRRRRGGEALRHALGRVDLSNAGVAGLYGLGLSALVTYAVVGAASGRVAVPGYWLIAATVPMTVTIGAAEYFLHRARGRSVAALGRSRVVHGFVAASRRQLRRMVALHATTVGVVAGAVLVLIQRGGVGGPVSGYAVGYAVLSVALLLCTTLLSLGFVGLAAALSCGAGAALQVVGGLPGLRGEQLVAAQLAVIALLLVIAYRLTATRFATVSVHR